MTLHAASPLSTNARWHMEGGVPARGERRGGLRLEVEALGLMYLLYGSHVLFGERIVNSKFSIETAPTRPHALTAKSIILNEFKRCIRPVALH